MTETIEIRCWRHGKINIEVEKPPVRRTVTKCPFCFSPTTMVFCEPMPKWAEPYRRNVGLSLGVGQ